MVNLQQLPTKGLMANEPALTTSSAVTFCTLLINALVSEGLPITPELKLLLVVIVGVLGPVVSGVIIRSHVFSPSTLSELQKSWSQVVTAVDTPTESVTSPTPPHQSGA